MSKPLFLSLLLCLSLNVSAQEEDLSVLNFYQYYCSDADAMYKQMVDEASVKLKARAQQIASLSSQSDWQARQTEVRARLDKIIGDFPEKTPLSPIVMARLSKDGVKVEKLVYESQPGFFVSAALFMPADLQGKAPAIIYCSGHAKEAFRSETYQRKILNLVHKGFIVLAFDPLGQGERMQYPSKTQEGSRIGGPTKEHGYVGAQCFMGGSSLAKYMIWDGIRAVDYLLSREEVDAKRIGITGRSGGGTQSAYIAAFDDRILASAPEAYITSLEILFKTKGPQDAEQNLMHYVDYELDLADLLEVRAPKPTMIISTTRDFFSIEGARRTYQEAKQAFASLGQPDHISMSEDDQVHASTPKNREAMYAFFQKHLSLPGKVEEREVSFFTPEELQVSSSGQLATAYDSKNVADLLREEVSRMKSEQLAERKKYDAQFIKEVALQLSGYQSVEEIYNIHFAGQFPRDSYTIQKYLMIGEKHVNPFLLFVPDEPKPNSLALYFHPEGKAAEASGEIRAMVKAGVTVLAADLLGTGELGPGYLKGDAYIDDVSYNQWFASVQVNKSIVARQAADMVKLASYGQEKFGNVHITAMAHSTLTPALIHASAFSSAFSQLVLVEPLVSYASLAAHEVYEARWVPASVAGAIGKYDLADLAAASTAKSLVLINPLTHSGEAVLPRDFEKEWGFVSEVYQQKGEFTIVYEQQELSTHLDKIFK
ncbi:acetylxylan esterase [Porifericola rhodea]|uniref:alpha/beta hydrolase family protein n=1 Tax=Porifericola rhodea TaxID=930972 RepID=UPI00266596CD|nr:acetylxylan esterase [Porifericola rhodea]WKN29910.1 acetylxylan esterase [Porifericola rhodea]